MLKKISLVTFVLLLGFQLLNAQEKDTISMANPKINKLLMPVQTKSQINFPLIDLSYKSFLQIDSMNSLPVFNYVLETRYLQNSSGLFIPSMFGLADIQNYGGNLGCLSLSENLSMDYGVFISAQSGYLFSSQQNVFGGNIFFKYAIAPKLYLLAWGQYVTPNDSSDPIFKMPKLIPKTNIGGGLQYNTSNNSGIRIGIEYQYDQEDKTWKAETGSKLQVKF